MAESGDEPELEANEAVPFQVLRLFKPIECFAHIVRIEERTIWLLTSQHAFSMSASSNGIDLREVEVTSLEGCSRAASS